MRRRPSRFEEEDASVGINNEAIALDNESGQDDLPISLEDVHQESAHDPVPNQEAIPMANQKIDRAIWGELKGKDLVGLVWFGLQAPPQAESA